MNHYPGSKGANGTWQQIISQIPKCDIFIEAMAGSGIISSHLSDCSCSIVTNDIDSCLHTNEHLHFQDLIDKYDCECPDKTVFYFDPPYLLSTRKSKRKIYKHEWTDQDHFDFLSRVLTVKSNCMISHYPCPLYNETLSNWRHITFPSMTHSGIRTECLWMNFPTPKLLLRSDKVGSDCWSRQAIKRKINRLQLKLAALDPIEKAAIFTQLKKEFGI